MQAIKITRAEANKLHGAKNCRFHAISEGCDGVWASGRTPESALANARAYFVKEEADFQCVDRTLDDMMADVAIYEVA